jgi:hypothetical protein
MANKPAVKKAASAGKPNRPATRPIASKGAAPANAPATRHISPEEAVAHIQALLDAKHERDRAANHSANAQPHGDSAVHTPNSPQLPSDAPKTTIPVIAGQRGPKA